MTQAAPGIATPFTSGTVTYLGPEGSYPNGTAVECDPTLADPRGVFLGSVVLSLTGGPLAQAGLVPRPAGIYVPGEDELFVEPPQANGPTLFYTSLWDSATGNLALQGRTQLARQLLALDNLRYRNTRPPGAMTVGNRTITLTVFTANGCVSNTLNVTVVVPPAPLAIVVLPSPTPGTGTGAGQAGGQQGGGPGGAAAAPSGPATTATIGPSALPSPSQQAAYGGVLLPTGTTLASTPASGGRQATVLSPLLALLIVLVTSAIIGGT